MTCYFRHMSDIFTELDVVVTKENKKDLDRKIHNYLGIEYKNCSATWKLIKERRDADRESFIKGLRTILTS